MNTSPLLMAAALLFWGWQITFPFLGLILALLLEGARFSPIRWQLSRREYQRISDLCSILFFCSLVYLFVLHTGPRNFFFIIQWLPLCVFPLMAAQAYGQDRQIDLSVLFLSIRNQVLPPNGARAMTINISHPYLVLVILAATAANNRTVWHYPALLGLTAWALWPRRSRRITSLLWLALLLFAGISGYGGQQALHSLQGVVEETMIQWLSQKAGGLADAERTTISIGEIGKKKLSSQILFRVIPRTGTTPPERLHLASYNLYYADIWRARRSAFRAIIPAEDRDTWQLDHGHQTPQVVTIAGRMTDRQNVLPLPYGTLRLTRLPAEELERNQYGTVRAISTPGRVSFDAQYLPKVIGLTPPSQTDLTVPDQLRPLLEEILSPYQERQADEAITWVKHFFQQNFSYSLTQQESTKSVEILQHFLLTSHRGHCELFATATTLLLRAAGVPARYATGYAVQEYSSWEKAFLVRARHAHAWTMVYLHGSWQVLDTTPANWSKIEDDNHSFLQPMKDIFSWAWYRTSTLFDKIKKDLPEWIGWLLLPLCAMLIWRLRTIRRVHLKQVQDSDAGQAFCQGKDSAFYRIEELLTAAGFGRRPGETQRYWLTRLEDEGVHSFDIAPLRQILEHHYRYRFDPDSATTQPALLQHAVAQWLAQVEQETQG